MLQLGVMEALLNAILHIGWLAVVGVIFAESGLMVGFFLPGDSLLFTAGFLVQQQVFQINIIVFIFACFLAAVAGNSTGYFIGKNVGRKLFNKEGSRFFKPEYLLQAEKFYEKHGNKTIVLAMFVPIVRAFTPVVAGIAKMEYKTFVLFNVLGAALWTSTFLLIGYFAGDVLKRAGINIEIAAFLIIFLSILPGILHVLKEPESRAKIVRKIRRKKQLL
jgi:membrane-associated protein